MQALLPPPVGFLPSGLCSFSHHGCIHLRFKVLLPTAAAVMRVPMAVSSVPPSGGQNTGVRIHRNPSWMPLKPRLFVAGRCICVPAWIACVGMRTGIARHSLLAHTRVPVTRPVGRQRRVWLGCQVTEKKWGMLDGGRCVGQHPFALAQGSPANSLVRQYFLSTSAWPCSGSMALSEAAGAPAG